jgi:hypothetical protein
VCRAPVREQYMALTFSTGRYMPYESLAARAAEMRGLTRRSRSG